MAGIRDIAYLTIEPAKAVQASMESPERHISGEHVNRHFEGSDRKVEPEVSECPCSAAFSIGRHPDGGSTRPDPYCLTERPVLDDLPKLAIGRNASWI